MENNYITRRATQQRNMSLIFSAVSVWQDNGGLEFLWARIVMQLADQTLDLPLEKDFFPSSISI